jgi:hypothetical protein
MMMSAIWEMEEEREKRGFKVGSPPVSLYARRPVITDQVDQIKTAKRVKRKNQ